MDPLMNDILKQPEVLRTKAPYYREQIAEVVGQIERDFQDRPMIMFTGMGASYFACMVPLNHMALRGRKVDLRETSELLYYQSAAIPEDALLCCVTQSGESIELKKLFDKLPSGTKVLTITNNPDSAVAVKSDYVLNLDVESDYSVAVKTYISSILLSLMLAQRLADGKISIDDATLDRMASSVENWLDDREGKTKRIADFIGSGPLSYISTGRGPAVASAMEAALLMREGAKTLCADVTGGQLRHGSVEVVSSNTRVINFVPNGETKALGLSLTKELLEYGAKVLLISDGESGLVHDNLLEVSLGREDEFISPLYDILPCQLLAHHMALSKGIVPGSFVNTVPVITTE